MRRLYRCAIPIGDPFRRHVQIVVRPSSRFLLEDALDTHAHIVYGVPQCHVLDSHLLFTALAPIRANRGSSVQTGRASAVMVRPSVGSEESARVHRRALAARQGLPYS
jgi:hypothetical protein